MRRMTNEYGRKGPDKLTKKINKRKKGDKGWIFETISRSISTGFSNQYLNIVVWNECPYWLVHTTGRYNTRTPVLRLYFHSSAHFLLLKSHKHLAIDGDSRSPTVYSPRRDSRCKHSAWSSCDPLLCGFHRRFNPWSRDWRVLDYRTVYVLLFTPTVSSPWMDYRDVFMSDIEVCFVFRIRNSCFCQFFPVPMSNTRTLLYIKPLVSDPITWKFLLEGKIPPPRERHRAVGIFDTDDPNWVKMTFYRTVWPLQLIYRDEISVLQLGPSTDTEHLQYMQGHYKAVGATWSVSTHLCL
jgi:hypothetical protein